MNDVISIKRSILQTGKPNKPTNFKRKWHNTIRLKWHTFYDIWERGREGESEREREKRQTNTWIVLVLRCLALGLLKIFHIWRCTLPAFFVLNSLVSTHPSHFHIETHAFLTILWHLSFGYWLTCRKLFDSSKRTNRRLSRNREEFKWAFPTKKRLRLVFFSISFFSFFFIKSNDVYTTLLDFLIIIPLKSNLPEN